MMKVCMIGPFSQGTGYSKAGIEYAMSMHEVGIDVVIRDVQMTNTKGSVPKEFEEFGSKDLNNVDTVFQYNLPSEFSYKGGVQNIGGFAYETNNYTNSGWSENLEIMDKIIVPCKEQKEFSLFPDKTFVVPYSIDIAKFDKEYDKMEFGLPKDCFKFYTISEFTPRKNIAALIAAYLSEFTDDDNVVLIIKTHMPNRDSGATSEAVKSLISDFKEMLGRFDDHRMYPKIILLTNYMPDNYIYSLHVTGDVFVSASHGEAWCLPAVDAMGFGNTIIVPDTGAFKDYVFHDIAGYLVEGMSSPVMGVKGAPKGLYTSDEEWFSINIKSLSQYMKLVYLNGRNSLQHTKSVNKEFIKNNLSREKVGNYLKEVINAK